MPIRQICHADSAVAAECKRPDAGCDLLSAPKGVAIASGEHLQLAASKPPDANA